MPPIPEGTAGPAIPIWGVTPRVHNGVVTNSVSVPPTGSTCTCGFERDGAAPRTFEVAPDSGGGWTSWAVALGRLLTRLVDRPTQYVVITQEHNQRYVQLALGHGNVRVEATSNIYLKGDFRLSAAEEERLGALGFRSPWDDVELEDAEPENWWFEELSVGGDARPVLIAERVVSTMTTVSAFDSRYPVTITMFGHDDACKESAWA